MKKIFIPALAILSLVSISCQNKKNEEATHSVNNESAAIENGANSWEGKTASLVDVNFNDGFVENGYGAIDSVVIQKLFKEVFAGTFKAVQDNPERKPLSNEEIITALKNSYNKINQDPTKKNFFIEANGEQIPMRDVLQILTKDKAFLQEPGFNLYRKTEEIGIVVQTYDPEGNERGKMILFWILLNEKKTV